MELTAQLRAWSYERQLLGTLASTIIAALSEVVAVYATHPTAPLSLRARCRSFSAAAYRGIDSRRAGLRFPAMRATVFLVPQKNASRVFTASRPSRSHALRPLKRHGFSETDYERFATRILPVADEPKGRAELEEAAGISGAELGTVLRCLRYEGRLLNLAGKSLNSSPHRFVATSSWIEGELVEGSTDEARAWLAGEYLRAFGPARSQDFAWWSGCTKAQATKALAHHDTIDLGDGLLLRAQDERNFARVRPVRNSISLLPRWDCYTMGHAPDGRRRFVHPDLQERVYTPIGVGLPGDGNPVVLVDGEVVATWTYSKKEGPRVQELDPLSSKARMKVDEELESIVSLLGSPA